MSGRRIIERNLAGGDRNDDASGTLAALFALSNGRLGIRAAALHHAGQGLMTNAERAFHADIHRRVAYVHPEPAHGLARTNERLLHIPHPGLLAIHPVEGRLHLINERWQLDPEAGRVEAETRFDTITGGKPAGGTHPCASARLVRCWRLPEDGSPWFEEELALEWPEDGPAMPVVVTLAFGALPSSDDPADTASPDAERARLGEKATLDPRRGDDESEPGFRLSTFEEDGPHVRARWQAGAGSFLAQGGRTVFTPDGGDGVGLETRITLHAEIDSRRRRQKAKLRWRHRVADRTLMAEIEFTALPASQLRIVRRVKYRPIVFAAVAKAEEGGIATGRSAPTDGSRGTLADWWQAAQVTLSGAKDLEEAIRHGLFHLHGAAPRARGSIPAKGLTGLGYEGHIFWDADVYMLPVFAALAPEVARRMLRFRIAGLDVARERAGELSLAGALYPWRTVSGSECSAYFPAGTAQYHINAGIAYALELYERMTGDEAFVFDEALVMLLETARLWPAIGHFTAEDRFEIACVTGPDEYNALVDNNTYTNLMAAAHLRYLEDVLRRYQQRDPEGWQRFSRRFGPSAKERETLARIARSIHVPRIEDADIPAQDSRFAMRRPWPRERTARPLLLHYHPLEIYRHRIIKQADVLLAMMLRREQFDRCEMARALRYYGPLTTHDSSLSPAPHAIIASWTGEWEAARAYFAESALVDLENRHANSSDGLHFASLAGAWRVISEGFAGFDPLAATASFRPRLPPWLEGYSFRLRREGRLIEIAVTPAGVRYRLLAGAPIDIRHDGRPHRLMIADELALPLRGKER